MHSYQQQFIEFALRRNVLKFGQFTLKSGRISPYFFNAGLFNTGDDLVQLGRFYSQAIIHHQLDFDLLFGPAYKGIPLAAATAMSLSQNQSKPIPFCFNRKESKDHGEGGITVGSPLQGRVLLIDDVITAGTAIREAMSLINQHGATLAAVIIALDRQERGQQQLSAVQEIVQTYQCPVHAIVTLTDLIDYLANQPAMAEKCQQMRQYQQQYA